MLHLISEIRTLLKLHSIITNKLSSVTAVHGGCVVIGIFSHVLQLVSDTVSQTSLVDKYTTLYESTQGIMDEHFGGLLQNKDLKDMHSAILDLYDQVR